MSQKKSKKDVDLDLKETTIISGSTSSTEEMETEDELFESLIRQEIKDWLALYGNKLFGLESSKFLAAEAKKKNLRGLR